LLVTRKLFKGLSTKKIRVLHSSTCEAYADWILSDLFLAAEIAPYRDLSVEIKRLISAGVNITISASGDKLYVSESLELKKISELSMLTFSLPFTVLATTSGGSTVV
jgi:hypothetical protein